MSSLAAIKAASHSRSLDDKANTERQRDILVLILSHLKSQGYIETATALLNESQSSESLARYDIADNVDLLQVLKEYDEYYKMKFGRRPVFCRCNTSSSIPKGVNGGDRTSEGSEAVTSSSRPTHPSSTRGGNKRRSLSTDRGRRSIDHALLPSSSTNQATTTTAVSTCHKRPLHEDDSNDENNPGIIRGFALNSSPTSSHQQNDTTDSHEHEPRNAAAALKPMPNFDGDPELRSLAMSIRRDIVQDCPRVHWNDIVGLDDAKRLLQETIILPRKYPELFTGIRSPWKSVLLYGMPGTGKTLLAKAVATEGNSTFFNISASSIVSKFRGDSEKLIRMLFDLARHYSPSTIFIDEVDGVMCHRGGGGFGSTMNEGSSSEHEGSRRMKTELLVQMDGLLAANNNSGVFVLAASNLPWDLDPAFLRRMEKRIMIPLPNAECRKEIISSQLSPFSSIFSKGEFLTSAASLVEGFSGSDLKALCKEVAMRPMRRILNDSRVLDGTLNGSENMSLLMKRYPITAQDFHDAIATVNHSTSAELFDRYRKWMDAHGSSC